MGALSPLHLLAIVVVALLVIGPDRLPEAAAGIGRAVREFRQALEDDPDDRAG